MTPELLLTGPKAAAATLQQLAGPRRGPAGSEQGACRQVTTLLLFICPHQQWPTSTAGKPSWGASRSKAGSNQRLLLDNLGKWVFGMTFSIEFLQLAWADICLRTTRRGRSCPDQQLTGGGPAALLPVDGHGQASPTKGLQV